MKNYHLITMLIAFGEMFVVNLHAQELNKIKSPKFNAVTVSHTGSFELSMAPHEALPLFTGPGEVLWVPNWSLVIFSGDGFEKGSVFQTSNHLNKTTWLVLDYDTENLSARYLRMTPDYDVGTVDVSLKANGEDGTIVNVAYQLTALSVERNKELVEWSTEAYAEEMEEWRALIIAAEDKITEHSQAGEKIEEQLPDTIEAGWKGKAVCELLYQDDIIRTGTCTYPPGTGQERHTHTRPYFTYVVSGGTLKVIGERGTFETTSVTGNSGKSDGVKWHELLNVGETTIKFLFVEEK